MSTDAAPFESHVIPLQPGAERDTRREYFTDDAWDRILDINPAGPSHVSVSSRKRTTDEFIDNCTYVPGMHCSPDDAIDAALGVVVVGLGASGKSSTANTLLGKPGFFHVEHGMQSRMQEPDFKDMCFEYNSKTIRIRLVDMPDIFDRGECDPVQHPTSIRHELCKLDRIMQSHHGPGGVHVFIFVINGAAMRKSQEEENLIKEMKNELLGFDDRALLVITHAKDLFTKRNIKSFVEQQKGQSNLLDMAKRAGRIMGVENRYASLYQMEQHRRAILKAVCWMQKQFPPNEPYCVEARGSVSPTFFLGHCVLKVTTSTTTEQSSASHHIGLKEQQEKQYSKDQDDDHFLIQENAKLSQAQNHDDQSAAGLEENMSRSEGFQATKGKYQRVLDHSPEQRTHYQFTVNPRKASTHRTSFGLDIQFSEDATETEQIFRVVKSSKDEDFPSNIPRKERLTDVFHFLPHNLKFKKEVEVRFHYSLPDPSQTAQLYYSATDIDDITAWKGEQELKDAPIRVQHRKGGTSVWLKSFCGLCLRKIETVRKKVYATVHCSSQGSEQSQLVIQIDGTGEPIQMAENIHFGAPFFIEAPQNSDGKHIDIHMTDLPGWECVSQAQVRIKCEDALNRQGVASSFTLRKVNLGDSYVNSEFCITISLTGSDKLAFRCKDVEALIKGQIPQRQAAANLDLPRASKDPASLLHIPPLELDKLKLALRGKDPTSFLGSLKTHDTIDFKNDTVKAKHGRIKCIVDTLVGRLSQKGTLCEVGSFYDETQVGVQNEYDHLYVLLGLDVELHYLNSESNNDQTFSLTPYICAKWFYNEIRLNFEHLQSGDLPEGVTHAGVGSQHIGGCRRNGPAATLLLHQDSELVTADITPAIPVKADDIMNLDKNFAHRWKMLQYAFPEECGNVDLHLVPAKGDGWKLSSAALERQILKKHGTRGNLQELIKVLKCFRDIFLAIKVGERQREDFRCNLETAINNLKDGNCVHDRLTYEQMPSLTAKTLFYIASKAKADACELNYMATDLADKYFLAHSFDTLDPCMEAYVNEIARSYITIKSCVFKYILFRMYLEDPDMLSTICTEQKRLTLMSHVLQEATNPVTQHLFMVSPIHTTSISTYAKRTHGVETWKSLYGEYCKQVIFLLHGAYRSIWPTESTEEKTIEQETAKSISELGEKVEQLEQKMDASLSEMKDMLKVVYQKVIGKD